MTLTFWLKYVLEKIPNIPEKEFYKLLPFNIDKTLLDNYDSG